MVMHTMVYKVGHTPMVQSPRFLCYLLPVALGSVNHIYRDLHLHLSHCSLCNLYIHTYMIIVIIGSVLSVGSLLGKIKV